MGHFCALKPNTKMCLLFPKTNYVYAVPRLILHIQKFSLSNTIAVWRETDHTQKGSLWRRLNGSISVAKWCCLSGAGTIGSVWVGNGMKENTSWQGVQALSLPFALCSRVPETSQHRLFATCGREGCGLSTLVDPITRQDWQGVDNYIWHEYGHGRGCWNGDPC